MLWYILLRVHVCFCNVVLDLVFKYQVKRLAGQNVSEMTYIVSGGTEKLNSVNQFWLKSSGNVVPQYTR